MYSGALRANLELYFLLSIKDCSWLCTFYSISTVCQTSCECLNVIRVVCFHIVYFPIDLCHFFHMFVDWLPSIFHVLYIVLWFHFSRSFSFSNRLKMYVNIICLLYLVHSLSALFLLHMLQCYLCTFCEQISVLLYGSVKYPCTFPELFAGLVSLCLFGW